MSLKFGFFIVFLLLFQPLEAKKKKQNKSPTVTVSSYVETISEFLQEIWEALMELLPYSHEPQPHKPLEKIKEKRKKRKQNNTKNWDYYVTTATKQLDKFFGYGRSREAQQGPHVEEVFSIELWAAEMLENFTWGLMGVVNNLNKNKS